MEEDCRPPLERSGSGEAEHSGQRLPGVHRIHHEPLVPRGQQNGLLRFTGRSAIPGSEMPVAHVHVPGTHEAAEAQKILHGVGTPENPLPLRVGASSNTDSADPDLTAPQCAKPDQETRVCLSTPAGDHDRSEIDTHVGRLLEKLPRGLYIGQRTQRAVTRRQMDHVGTLSLGRQLLGERVQRTVGTGLVFAFRIGMDLGTEQTIQKHVPRQVVLGRHALYAILELDHAAQAELGCGGRRTPGVVRLHGTGDEDHRRSPGYGFAAIIVAFLGRLHPVGVVLASLLMALMYLGGETLQMDLNLPLAVTGVFQGMLLFFVLASDVLIRFRLRWVRPARAAGKAVR